MAKTPTGRENEIHKYRSWRNYLKGLYGGREVDFVATGRKDFQTPEGIRVAPALLFLSRLV